MLADLLAIVVGIVAGLLLGWWNSKCSVRPATGAGSLHSDHPSEERTDVPEREDGSLTVYPDFSEGNVIFEVGRDGDGQPDFTCSLPPEIARDFAYRLSLSAMQIEERSAE